MLDRFVYIFIGARDVLNVKAVLQPLASHLVVQAAVISILEWIESLKELVSTQVDHAFRNTVPGFVFLVLLLLLWLLRSKDILVRDDETLRIVDRAALSSLETYFMDKRRDSVHLKQRLDVFFVHEAGFGNLELMEALVLLANP